MAAGTWGSVTNSMYNFYMFSLNFTFVYDLVSGKFGFQSKFTKLRTNASNPTLGGNVYLTDISSVQVSVYAPDPTRMQDVERIIGFDYLSGTNNMVFTVPTQQWSTYRATHDPTNVYGSTELLGNTRELLLLFR